MRMYEMTKNVSWLFSSMIIIHTHAHTHTDIHIWRTNHHIDFRLWPSVLIFILLYKIARNPCIYQWSIYIMSIFNIVSLLFILFVLLLCHSFHDRARFSVLLKSWNWNYLYWNRYIYLCWKASSTHMQISTYLIGLFWWKCGFPLFNIRCTHDIN